MIVPSMDQAPPIGRTRRRRVFLGPVEVAGHYAGLEAAFRTIGVDALAVDLLGHPFRYRVAARDPRVVRLARWAWMGRRGAPSRSLRSVLWMTLKVATSLLLLGWAVVRFDAFIFGFGYTILGTRELPLLRRLGKRIVCVFHGSDARPPYIDGTQMAPDRALPIAECLRATRRTKARVRRIERYADVVVAQPTFSHLFGRPVVNFFSLGVLWQDRPITPVDATEGQAIRILHSPSDPTVKGSARIRATVDALIADGLQLELVELRGVPNDVVRQHLAGCDFAIDQIYSDAPMVGFATEAAVAGKPTIVGGYAWPENHRIFDPGMPPVEECSPEELTGAIRRLALDAEHRAALGARARRWVVGEWAPQAVGRRYLQLLDGAPSPEWLFDPFELRYVEGCGLTRTEAREVVRSMIATHGLSGLCLSDKPELEAAFAAFAAEES